MKHFFKITIFIYSIVFILFVFGCGKKEEGKPTTEGSSQTTTQKPAGAIYESKSGIIEYEVKFIGDQKQILYFDDYGKKEVKITTTEIEMMGIKSKLEEVEINADGYFTKYDVEKKTGTKMKSPGSLGSAQGFPGDLDNITKELMEQYKLKDLGKKEIAGKECKGFGMDIMGMGSEVWVWKNIPLYTKVYLTKDSEPMEIKAIKVEIDVPVPPEKFQVPADVKLTEMQ
jgi:uncharacterized lipoprotein YehR (DUF1307 family)